MAVPNNLSRFLLPIFHNVHEWAYDFDATINEICGRLIIFTDWVDIFIWPYKKHLLLFYNQLVLIMI